MANFLSTKIALRTDTIQNWNSLSNQILLNGEVAIVMTDEKLPLFKIGDGVHKFYELPYSNSKISSDTVNAVDIIAKSICQGANSSAVPQSLAAGFMVSSDVPYSQAFGYNTKTKSGDVYSFTWSGEASRDINSPYSSHAIGSFNINPNDGLSGFYIGDRNLKEVIEGETSDFSKVTLISNDVAYSKDLSVVKIAGEEYYKLVAGGKANPSVLYVVDDPYLNAYGQTIKNVAFPELSNDAATKNYVDSEIAKIPQPDLTEFVKLQSESTQNISSDLNFINTSYLNKVSSDFNLISSAISSDEFLSSKIIELQPINDNFYILLDRVNEIRFKAGISNQPLDVNTTTIFKLVDAINEINDKAGLPRLDNYSQLTELYDDLNASLGKLSENYQTTILEQFKKFESSIYAIENNIIQLSQKFAEKKDIYEKNETSSNVQLNAKFSTLSTYIQTKNQLSNDGYPTYIQTKNQLSNDGYPTYIQTKNQLSNDGYLTEHYLLDECYTKSETSSATQIADAIKNNVQVSAALDSGTQIASISVDGVATPIYAPDGGASEWGSIDGNVEDQRDLIKVNYPLDNPTASSETVDDVVYRRFDIKDHTIATISLSDETPVRIHFPDKPTENFCRDFIVKIKVTSGNIPQVQFIKGQNDASIGFEYEDDSWATLEVGINYFTFTETERE